MVNCFEVHLGFPNDGASALLVPTILERLRSDQTPWTCSEVRDVFVKRPGCFDPHNVPGTLRWLISREIAVQTASVGADGDRAILDAAQIAVNLLAENGLSDARLEIEYPFGFFDPRLVKDRVVHTEQLGDPMTIEPEELNLQNAIAVPNTPRWEIHFIVESLPASTPNEHTIHSVPDTIESHEVVVEQTIEYRSQHMQEIGQSGYKFISTSYCPDREKAESEARRLFHETTLCADFFGRGYTIKLLLEHIVGCFKPTSLDESIRQRLPRLEVSSAQ